MEMHRTDHQDGSATLHLNLTEQEATALGADAGHTLTALAQALWATADLRTGQPRDAWWPVVLECSRLMRQLEGVRDAALREMPQASHAEVAHAVGMPRSTVSSRRQAGTLPPADPTQWETWARTGTYPQDAWARTES